MRILLCLFVLATLRADDRSLVILFGPAGEDGAKVAAHAVAGMAHDWLKIDGSVVELRRPGVGEGQELTKYLQPKDLEQTLGAAAQASRQFDLVGFLNSLDKASYALARRHGKRVLLAVLETPSPAAVSAMKGGADELQNRLGQTIDFCKSNLENVVVLAAGEPSAAWKGLATGTGGALVRDPQTLASNILLVAPVTTAAAANAPASPDAVSAPAGLPVHIRMFRTQPLRTKSVNTDMGPMNGLLLVECPFRGLQFESDERAGKYSVQARVTETVRNAEGKTVWQAKKDISVKEPIKKKESREAGSMFYMRELQLPGGQYTIEATVEDLTAGKSGTARQPLQATDSLPGFAVSDALFVRPLKDNDRFEADQVFNYDGNALAPVLDPVFKANEEFNLQMYLIIYPDLGGGQPEISLEILQNGQAVGRSKLAFNDKIRNTSTEGSALGSRGEQKHEFPFLANILKASFDAGKYEAQITVRQGRNTIMRSVAFRVVR